MADDQEKKLIIDDDWKQEAQREKEILAEQQKQAEETESVNDGGERGPLPPASFSGLVSVFTTQAYLALGLLRMQGEEERAPDLEMAKYNIDLLGVIEEKTKGNLDDEEAKVLSETLQNMRMAFVQLSQ
ncbi:DUF1844 domain-containing protein [Planctomycetota bacterium]